MKIWTGRTILSLILLIGMLVTGILVIRKEAILESFREIEREELTSSMDRCKKALDNELTHLDNFCSDWSSWNDTYNFISSQSPDYISANLNWQTMAESSRINLFYLYDKTGKLIYHDAFEPRKGHFHVKSLMNRNFALKGNVPSRAAGIIMTEEGLMMLALRPVLKNNGQGPAAGTLMMGRLIDSQVLSGLQQQTGVNLTIRGLKGDCGGSDQSSVQASDPASAIAPSSQGIPPHVMIFDVPITAECLLKGSTGRNSSNQPIFGASCSETRILAQDDLASLIFRCIKDPWNCPSAILAAKIPRHVMARGTRAANMTSLANLLLLAALLLLVLSVGSLLNKSIFPGSGQISFLSWAMPSLWALAICLLITLMLRNMAHFRVEEARNTALVERGLKHQELLNSRIQKAVYSLQFLSNYVRFSDHVTRGEFQEFTETVMDRNWLKGAFDFAQGGDMLLYNPTENKAIAESIAGLDPDRSTSRARTWEAVCHSPLGVTLENSRHLYPITMDFSTKNGMVRTGIILDLQTLVANHSQSNDQGLEISLEPWPESDRNLHWQGVLNLAGRHIPFHVRCESGFMFNYSGLSINAVTLISLLITGWIVTLLAAFSRRSAIIDQKVQQRTLELQTQKSYLETLLAAIPDMVVMRDSNGARIFSNQAGMSDIAPGSRRQELERAAFANGKTISLDLCESIPGVDCFEDEKWYATTITPVRLPAAPPPDTAGQDFSSNEPERAEQEENSEAVTGILTIMRDITVRKNYEHRLLESEEKIRVLLETLPVAVILSTLKDGTIIRANSMATRLLGVKHVKLIHMNRVLCLGPGSATWPLCGPDQESIETQSDSEHSADPEKGSSSRIIRSLTHEADISIQRGTVIPVLRSAVVLKSGNELCLLEAFVNISEQKQNLQDLERARFEAIRANNAKGEFLAAVSHEMRTPLAGLLGMADLLIRLTDSKSERDIIKSILTTGRYLMSMTEELLDISRIEEGRFRIHPMKFNPMESVIHEALDMVLPLADVSNLNIVVDPPAEKNMTVLGDPARMKQILVNLLSNAIKFTGKGTITLSMGTHRSDRPEFPDSNARIRFGKKLTVPRIWFNVRDCGSGIAQEDLHKIFMPFEQAAAALGRLQREEDGYLEPGSTDSVLPSTDSAPRNRPPLGAGLGLSIVRSMVTAMSGALGAESSLNRGSSFWFEIPVEIDFDSLPTETSTLEKSPMTGTSEQATSIVPDSATAMSAPLRAPLMATDSDSPLRILLLEDDRTCAMVARMTLELSDCAVELAHTWKKAQEILHRQSMDLLIIDQNLPDALGTELLHQIRSGQLLESHNVDASIPVIFLTALATDIIISTCDQYDNVCLITKPLLPEFVKHPQMVRLPARILEKLNSLREIPIHATSRDSKVLVEIRESDILNLANLRSVVSEPSALADLADNFVTACHQYAVTASQALEALNEEVFRLNIHSLQGSSSTIGADNMNRICHEIHRIISPDDAPVPREKWDLAALRGLLNQAMDEMARIQGRIQEELSEA